MLNERFNFNTFGASTFMLFILASGDSFQGTMLDLQRTSPVCDDSHTCTTNCCTNRWIVVLYFSTFLVIVQLVLLNIVVVCFASNNRLTHAHEHRPS